MAKKIDDRTPRRGQILNGRRTTSPARAASELLPQYIGRQATDELIRRGRGRPTKPDRKVNQTLRLDPDVVEAYRREGPGWQAHMNDVLRQHMPRHSKR
jgi:uncharacterized protein (DUF4415 family)